MAPINATKKSARVVTPQPTRTTLTQAQKDEIYTEILDGIINKIPGKESTHAIAEKLNVSVMSVAGIRSAFTKGQYGVPKNLIRRRRTQLRNAGLL